MNPKVHPVMCAAKKRLSCTSSGPNEIMVNISAENLFVIEWRANS
jgi:hypothetical protein